jgi:hypothetical protein
VHELTEAFVGYAYLAMCAISWRSEIGKAVERGAHGIGGAASPAATQLLSASSKTYLLQTFPLKIHLFSQDRFGGPVRLPDVSLVFI